MTAEKHGPKPTIVLVHGAFADASGWNGVAERLERRGYNVIAPANPLRDVKYDAAYITSVVSTVPGPVVLVGHSYGGVVISNVALDRTKVKALVYIAGFAPEKDESAFGITAQYPGSHLGPKTTVERKFPVQGGGEGTDVYINEKDFRDVFAADLSPRVTANMFATQRPVAATAGAGPSGEPLWRLVPSWYQISLNDHAIPPAAQEAMAKRAKAHTTRVTASHVAMISRPDASAQVILEAARAR
nr:alpha/beta hydrolase [Kibdelosporangium sp. MJ126-NF4]